MHRIDLSYTLTGERRAAALHHPLIALLAALHRHGSISAAAREQGRSYRHVWGELKRWEAELGRELVIWAKGQPATLTSFGEKLLRAEQRAQARLAPQIEALRGEIEAAFAEAFDDRVDVLTVFASHDQALPRLRDLARAQGLHLDLGFVGSLDALTALNEGRCQLAGFHLRDGAGRGSASARAYRPRLKPGLHKLIGFTRRTQGLMTAPGNPLAIAGLADLQRPGLRLGGRAAGTGTRLLFDELLAEQGLPPRAPTLVEPSHAACAQAVLAGAADAAFGIEAAARAAGLHFLPLVDERYFLVTLKALLAQPALQRLVALLAQPAWAAELDALPGYAPLRTGEVLSLTRMLPWWSQRPPR